MKEHAPLIAGVLTVAMLLATSVIMAMHGIKEEAILMVLFQGATTIGGTMVGVKIGQAMAQIPQTPQLPQLPQQPQTLPNDKGPTT